MTEDRAPYGEPRRLSEIADVIGYGVSDLALLAGCDDSTISRLWDDPRWLDRVKGRTLQALVAAVPGVADYVANHPQDERQARLVRELAAEGLMVDLDAIETLRSDIPRPYVTLALDAGLHITRGDQRQATAMLPRIWGRLQDGALEALFRPCGGLLTNPAQLHAAAADLTPRLTRSAYSLHAILAQSQLAHHVARSTGQTPDLGVSGDLGRQGAVALRSSTMGALACDDDSAAAERYRRHVEQNPVARFVEEWAFPNWTRDCRPAVDMVLPRSLLLRRTAAEILREIDCYGAGYLYYLVTTYLPLALRRDATFGLRVADLRAALIARRETVTDPTIRRAVESFARLLPTGATA